MELLERYLQAVKFWLPKEQKQDIIAELSEDISSQIEERESQLGRNLTEAEIEGILKQRGRPVLVANRFLPQQYLIGPVLFPIYTFVLRIVALCYLLPWVLVWIGIMTYSPTYRIQHGGWLGGIGQAWGGLWITAFIVIGVVTVVFAVLEQVQAKSRFLENWNPRKLPPVRNPNQIPRSASIIEIVANSVFGVWWWVAYMSSPLILNRPEIRILLSPTWRYFFWGILCVTLVNIALSAANLNRPYWTVRRAMVRLMMGFVGSALFCWLMKANIVAEITVPNVSAARTSEITNAINLWMGRALPAAIAVCIVIVIADAYRIYRVKTNRGSLSQGVALAVM